MMKSATMSPRSSGARALPATLTFGDAELAIIDRDGRPWIAAADLARALGYARVDQVSRIYERHAAEFSEAMTLIVNLAVPGNPMEIPVRIFSPRGCHLVAMFSRTERAAALPEATASIAFCAIDWPVGSWSLTFDSATNHWSVSMGSTTCPVRAQRGTTRRCFFVSSSTPSASRSATTALRATKRSMPRYFAGALSLIDASRFSTPITGRLCRWPTA